MNLEASMSSIPPPGGQGSDSFMNNMADAAAGIPQGMVQGPLLPADHPFVKAVTEMFGKTGFSENTYIMQQVATQLMKNIQQSISNQIKQEEQLSRQRRQQDLRELLGEG
jgi:hypothetical protein